MTSRPLLRATTLFVTDLSAVFISWVLAVLVAEVLDRGDIAQWFPLSTQTGRAFSVMVLLVLTTLGFTGQYMRRSSFWDETRIIWRYVVLFGLAHFAINFLVQVTYTRTITVLAWLFVAVLVPLGRLFAREALVSFGAWKRATLVVGDGDAVLQACETIRRERHVGMAVAGLVTLKGNKDIQLLPDVPVFSLEEGIDNCARRLGCEVVIIVMEADAPIEISKLISSLHEENYEVFIVPSLKGVPVHGVQAQYFFSHDLLFLRLQHRLLQLTSRIAKRTTDIALSSLGLIAASPLLLWVALRIWREDGAPVIYSQLRVGAGGKDFRFYKFRSMVRNADEVLESWKSQNPELYEQYVVSNFKLASDPRVLRVGSWIRRTSIDELPQLWNVLRGDMSLVGPRPLLRRELPDYPQDALSLYKQVRPGISGLWQVGGRSNTTFEQRALMDGWYVRNWSLWIDLVILLKTVRVVLSARGAV